MSRRKLKRCCRSKDHAQSDFGLVMGGVLVPEGDDGGCAGLYSLDYLVLAEAGQPAEGKDAAVG